MERPFCPLGRSACVGMDRCRFALCDTLLAAGRWLVAHEYSEVTIKRNAGVVQVSRTLRERAEINCPSKE